MKSWEEIIEEFVENDTTALSKIDSSVSSRDIAEYLNNHFGYKLSSQEVDAYRRLRSSNLSGGLRRED